jgi:putative ABC transport system permease protein
VNALKQVRAVTALALAAVPQRLGTSLVIVIGTATSVAVLIAALAVATSFSRAMAKTGSADRAIVLGGFSESSSDISPGNAAKILDAPGVAHTAAGQPIASAEVLNSIPLTNMHTGLESYVTVRGVGPLAFKLRPQIRLVTGRFFEPGKREVIVGRALEERLGSLPIGSHVAFPDGDWTVVGLFSSGGDSHQSELMTDASSLMSAFHRNAFNSMTVQLTSARHLALFSAAVASDPTLSVKAQREDEYYATLSRPVSLVLEIVAYGIGGIMSFGAVFGALNTMFSAVRARKTEIATLRAIGFGAASVIASVIIEALLLGLAGALAGALGVWVALDGTNISTMMAAATTSQITFGLEVGPRLIMIGVLFALGIAFAGAVFAAGQAARISVAAAMRET